MNIEQQSYSVSGSNVVVSLILGRQAGRLASPTLVICPCVDGVDYFTFRCLVVLAGWEGRQYQVVSRAGWPLSQAAGWLQAHWPDSVEKVTAVGTGRESSM